MSVETLLDYRSLKSMYETERNSASIPTPFTDTFFVNPSSEECDDFLMVVDTVENRPAPLNVKGGKARTLDKAGADERRGVLFHTFNVMPFGSELTDAIREPDSEVLDRKATRETRRQLSKFARRHVILKEVICSKIITEGEVHYDIATGSVVESGGSGILSPNFGVDATHQGNLGGLVSGYITSSGFALQKLIDDVRNQAEKENAPVPTEIWVHPTIKQYLRLLTEFQTWVTLNSQDANTVLRGDTIDDLYGMNWHFIGGRYKNASGTMQSYMPEKKMIFTPPVNEGWISASQGKTLVPTSLDIYRGDPLQGLASMDEVYGPYSYAVVAHNPPGLECYNGEVFGLNFANPDAIWQAQVIAP